MLPGHGPIDEHVEDNEEDGGNQVHHHYVADLNVKVGKGSRKKITVFF